MVSYVSDYRALMSGTSWWGAVPAGRSTIITYSFETSVFDHVKTSTYSDAFRSSFKPLNASQKAATLAALKQLDDASGLQFIEVAPGQGDIKFANYDLSKDPTQSTAAGYAYYPGVTIGADASFIDDIGGDVFLDDGTMTYSAADQLHVILHEVGHALGLKHPFQGDIRLDPTVDNTKQTVMSYTGYDPTLGPIDIAALRVLYGDDAADGTHIASWAWNAATATMTQTGGAGADTIRGVSTVDVIRGMGGNDLIVSGKGNDWLYGDAGDDVLFGGADNDTLDGGADNDRLDGADGDDTLNGGTGNDTLNGWAGIDRLNGGAGDDTLDGGDGNDRLDGGDGNDTLNGRAGTNTLLGGGGNDTLHGGASVDTMDGGTGDDRVSGWEGADVLAGGIGRDLLWGGIGDDRLTGGDGDDEMQGEAGNDTLIGDAGKDSLWGQDGNDRLTGGLGDDFINGGTGTDTVDYSATTGGIIATLGPTISELVNGTWVWYNAKSAEIGYDVVLEVENILGGQGADTITGNGAANLLDGRGGADRLTGGGGNDTYRVDHAGDRVFETKGQGVDRIVATQSFTLAAGQEIETLEFGTTGASVLTLRGNEFGQTLIGNAGANALDGALGSDILTGGAGGDRFLFTTKLGTTNVDRITDFASEDTVQLAQSIFTALGAGTLSTTAFKDISKAAADADDRILYKPSTGELFYDADGLGSGAKVKLAVFDNKAALTAADFFVA
ncbi:matrixin family metalloprotease [Methylobacterium sp. Leaf118]|uniref:matrixin family metalloprotease n=1 Tax=Methylobacterium sp. Leaf118 TaxID=2876562 RepID=UPI0022B7810A|nr:matrixin family metalloprotease [Methylobacterium sp. Leaf118]